MHEKFWPTYFIWPQPQNKQPNTYADVVKTLSDECVEIVNDTLDTHAPYRYATKKGQRSFNKAWLAKVILTSIAKKDALCRKQIDINNPNIIRHQNL